LRPFIPLRADRKLDPEGASIALDTIETDVSAHCLDDTFGDHQANPGTLCCAMFFPQPVGGIEDAIMPVRRDAVTWLSYVDTHTAVVCRIAQFHDFLWLVVLDGVGEEVDDRLAQFHVVSQIAAVSPSSVWLNIRMSFLVASGVISAMLSASTRFRGHGFDCVFEFSCFDAGQINQVIDQVQHVFSRLFILKRLNACGFRQLGINSDELGET
jgi:hypothetical protein